MAYNVNNMNSYNQLGKMITYTDNKHRLIGLSYSDDTENNVKYYYGFATLPVITSVV